MLKLGWSSATRKRKIVNREYHQSNFLPYQEHWNSTTLVTKDGSLLKVIKLSGYAFETADDEDLSIQNSIRNQTLRSMSSAAFGLYFHIIRRRRNAFSEGFAGKQFSSAFADAVNMQWRNKHMTKQSFTNDLYITIVREGSNKSTELFVNLLQKINKKAATESWKNDMRAAFEDLEEVTNRVVTSLRNYAPRELGIRSTPAGDFSEIMEFLLQIVNCGAVHNVAVDLGDISKYLPMHRLYFGHKVVQVVCHDGSKYAGLISLKEYGQTTSAGMLDAFLQLPYEFIITQSFKFTNRQAAITKMQIQQNRMIQSSDKAVSQIYEISKALDDAMSGKIAFGHHHLTVLCIEKTPKNLENALSLVEAELSNCGVYPVREKVNLEPAFWAQLPGNFSYVVRKAVISTLNMAGFASQHNYPSGQKFGNHWGEAVTVFDTTSGTPFFFSFHMRDVGHTAIIGPTGAGKTVLMNFLCVQAMKFSPRVFFFDKDHGAEIFIRALKGVYSIIETRGSTGLNPLHLDDTPDNRGFLMEWFKLLATTLSDKLTPDDILRIDDAIEGNFKLKKEDRKLRNLVPFLGIGGEDTLASRMMMWHSEGSHAALFDNDEDVLDFTKSRVFGFEMGYLLKDPMALAPTLLYLFHKISISLDGTPSMIILDEAWALIDNPVFAPRIKDWLKVLRKLNTFVIFATQSVEDASKSQISDTLVQQTATQIFLPNLKATSAYRDVFMLTEREYSLIKYTDPGTRFFLVKQGVSAVVARIDLRGLDDTINVLSGRAETVAILREIMEEVGNDPNVWLPIFYQRVKNA
ncbi:VirB4 family type IV secretion/conjugal transfer ATPase [Anaplasma phagocytophilum]|uniref:Type IV secretion system protein virB4 n=6 Tax=Anaplasma phagocytophilum TaxID=948 RepID=K9P1R7_ANAPH|nr:VirB4 family type IV secretion/conjugal transfer ATPase [Anaplasma phagocytophilum]AFY26836.1 type IV secretion system protein [Anaplasma phagocytophilum]EOA63165.1 type IV secretion system ATPase VirB4 [Anaplasma phagocytophilum str. CRT38]KDB57490.1 type IV secretion system ATPase VirB4 [Anaplasma phagocytophilum str. CRT35]QLL66578.1 VirB4 family type IV secretion/conjugal transfer ATPase [Anaplasma phagocytophilum str. Norway variant1]